MLTMRRDAFLLEWAVVGGGALLAALFGLLLDIQTPSPGLAEGGVAALSLAAGIAHSLSFLAAGWLAGQVVCRILGWSTTAWTAGMVAAWCAYSAVGPQVGAYHTPLPGLGPSATLPTVLLCAAFGFLLGAAIVRLDERGGALAAAAGLGLTVAAAVFTLAAWQFAFSSGPLSASVLAAGMAVVTALAALAFRGRLRPVSVLAATAAVAVLAAAAGALHLASGASEAEELVGQAALKPARVILISIDTLRADTALASMPNLQELAEECVVFDNAHSPGPWTVPGLLSLHTGLHPLVHGGNSLTSRLPEGVPTLAGYLGDAGYETSNVGVNTFIRLAQVDREFQTSSAHPPLSLGSSPGKVLLAKFVERYAGGASTTELSDMAIRELERLRDEEFFFWLHYFDPHTPYDPPPAFLEGVERDPSLPTPIRDRDFGSNEFPVKATPDRVAWIRAAYEAEASYTDEQAGRVIERLRELDLFDDALIIVTSDHGEEFFEHGGFGHIRTLYEELLRVPLMIKLPQASSTGHVEEPVETTSVVPTILDLAGLDYDPAQFSSPSLAPYWSDAPPAGQPVFGYGARSHEEPMSVMWNGRKLIRYSLMGREALYDMETDPGESRPRSADEVDESEELRLLLDDKLEAAGKLRETYGIAASSGELDSGTVDVLKSLGYIQ